jgi:hypothetical protein
MSMTRPAGAGSTSTMTRPSDAELQGKAAALDQLMQSEYSKYVANRSTNSYKLAKKAAASLAKIGQLADKWYPIFKLPKPRATTQGPQKQLPGQVTPPAPSSPPPPVFQTSSDVQQTAATSAITTETVTTPDGSTLEVPVVVEEQLEQVPSSSSSSFSMKPVMLLAGLALAGTGVYMWSRRR